jgi:alpha-glucosidase
MARHDHRFSLSNLASDHVSQNRFPDPKSMVDDLHSIGCKSIWMLDPGIKKEDGYFVYESGSKNDVWIKKEDHSPFIGTFR